MAARAALVLIVALAVGATVTGGWTATTIVVGVVLFGVAWAVLSNFVALHHRRLRAHDGRRPSS
jgi:hypothetical protein